MERNERQTTNLMYSNNGSNLQRRTPNEGSSRFSAKDVQSDSTPNKTKPETKAATVVPARKSGGINLYDIFDSSEVPHVEFFLVVRIISILGWTGSVLYGTYHVFIACEKYLDVWYKDPIMNPSPFSTLIGRGRDSTDYEWEMFTHIFVSKLWLWYGLYAIMSRTLQTAFPKYWNIVSTALSFLMLWNVTGVLPTVFLVLQPVIYWGIAQLRSKLLLWTATVLFIYNLNNPFIYVFIPDNRLSEYFFVITAAWSYARCISFCYDVWEKTEVEGRKLGLNYLWNGIHYCYYLPLAISGPLVTYESFEKNIIQKNEDFGRRNMTEDIITLLKKLLRLGLNIVLIELTLHFVYFRALSMTTSVHPSLSLWAICGTIYWLGQFFSMKYKILYGIPTCIAEFDGMEMPPLPKCPSYLHRYSVLWRDFDRGLYRFLVKYIYLPTLGYVKSVDKSNMIPLDVKKLMASFMSFVYVYIWHSLSFDVFIWAALNFIGITVERIGSVMKREIDKRMRIQPIEWDFWIEPIVTVPLAAMSILNSSIFCGSMEAAVSFSSELWKRREDNWVLFILYFFTHTAVTFRTWRHKLYKLFVQIIWYESIHPFRFRASMEQLLESSHLK